MQGSVFNFLDLGALQDLYANILQLFSAVGTDYWIKMSKHLIGWYHEWCFRGQTRKDPSYLHINVSCTNNETAARQLFQLKNNLSLVIPSLAPGIWLSCGCKGMPPFWVHIWHSHKCHPVCGTPPPQPWCLALPSLCFLLIILFSLPCLFYPYFHHVKAYTYGGWCFSLGFG